MTRKSMLLSVLFCLSVTMFAVTIYADDCPKSITAIPCIISSSGSYKLADNLVDSYGSVTAITISSDNVDLDFAGYELQNMTTGTGWGIGYTYTASPRKNIRIRNGRISGFASAIDMAYDEESQTHLTDAIIDGLVITANGGQGIRIDGNRITIKNCSINQSSESDPNHAISASGNSIYIINNDVFDSNGTASIRVCGEPSPCSFAVIENNRVSSTAAPQSGAAGIWCAAEHSIIVNNRISNMGTGIDLQASNIKYRDNIVSNCTTTYSSSAGDIGNNN